MSLSGVAEPFDSGCGRFLEADGHRYQSDLYQWGTTNEIVFTENDSIPSVYDDPLVLPFLHFVFAKRQQLEAELNLATSTSTSELDDSQAHYTYVLDGDQAFTLAGRLAAGRIQSDLYLPSRSTGELHLIEIDGRITEIKMSASFEGEEIVKPTTSYRNATTLEVHLAIEDLPNDEPRVKADSNDLAASCDPQPDPEAWLQD